MKKVILSLAIAAMATASANAQVSFGVQAGVNLATTKSEDKSVNPTQTERGKTMAGFTAGLVANIPFSSMLSFRPEVNYIQKGGKYSSSQTIGVITYASTDKVSMNFIEIPLNIVFSLPAGPGRFCVGAGPNFSFGLSGKDKSTSTTTGQPSTSDVTKIKFDGKESSSLPVSDPYIHLKSFDMGADAFIGYKMNMGLFFNAGYTYGFSNLNPEKDLSLKTAGITLKVGYLLGGKSKKKDD